jgi:hypothetical protein
VEKSSMEIIKKKSLTIFWEIIRQETIVIWCVILYNPIMACNMFLTLEAPVVLHYLKAPTAVKLTAVWFIAF